MKKNIFFFCLFFLSTNIYAIEKTLLCSGINHTGGKITSQEAIDFNFTFDGVLQRITSIPTFLTCQGFGSLPLLQVMNFTKVTIFFESKNKEEDTGKCSSFFTLNRNSGSFKSTKILGDSYNPTLIYEGTFKCELAKQKF
jgi:hypothetical protein